MAADKARLHALTFVMIPCLGIFRSRQIYRKLPWPPARSRGKINDKPVPRGPHPGGPMAEAEDRVKRVLHVKIRALGDPRQVLALMKSATPFYRSFGGTSFR